jgi:hypothetical protein
LATSGRSSSGKVIAPSSKATLPAASHLFYARLAPLARGARGRGIPTGHDDEEHPATFAFKVGQQVRVAATRSTPPTRPGQATSPAQSRTLRSAL